MKKVDYCKLNTLEKLFKDMNSEKGNLGLTLLDEAFFMQETLKRLKEDIRKNNVTVEMSQGSYSINRSNPALKTYNTLIKNFASVIKQITDLIPEKNNIPAGERIMSFLASDEK